MKNNLFILALFILSIAPLELQADDGKFSEDVYTRFSKILDKESTTIDFSPNSAVIRDPDRQKIRGLIQGNRQEAKIDRIIIAAWSDKKFPTHKNRSLSDADKDLAQKRLDSLEKVVEQLGDTPSITTYSMASYPSWIARVFDSDTAEIKKSVAGKEKADPNNERIAQALENKGGPSKAVILVFREKTDVPPARAR